METAPELQAILLKSPRLSLLRHPEATGTAPVLAAGLITHEAPYVNYLPEFYQDAYPEFYQNENGVWGDGFSEQSMIDALDRLA